MSSTLTVRIDEFLTKALKDRARSERKTISQVAREILSQALTERPLAERVGHLKGRLELGPIPENAWRRQIESRNRRT